MDGFLEDVQRFNLSNDYKNIKIEEGKDIVLNFFDGNLEFYEMFFEIARAIYRIDNMKVYCFSE